MGSNHIWRNQTQTSTVVWWRPLKIFRTPPRFPCGPTLQQVLRMMLLLFLDDIRSERDLMRIIPGAARLRSVLSKARKRRGKDVFLALFSRFVHQCVEARLVEGSKIYVDARLVDANASSAQSERCRPKWLQPLSAWLWSKFKAR